VDNHYHTLGYLRERTKLPMMMQRIHGSVAKLVNDLLPQRRAKFWQDAKLKQYFDGCIRDEKQARLAYRYIPIQGQRHGCVRDWRESPHARARVELERDHASTRTPGVYGGRAVQAVCQGAPGPLKRSSPAASIAFSDAGKPSQAVR
jgi:hypothetical protein